MQTNTAQPAENQIPRSCPHCGSAQVFVRDEAPHIALRCGACERWIRWVRRSEAAKYPSEATSPVAESTLDPQPTKIDMRKIAHPRTLEERVASLEHDIGMIAQIMVRGDAA